MAELGSNGESSNNTGPGSSPEARTLHHSVRKREKEQQTAEKDAEIIR